MVKYSRKARAFSGGVVLETMLVKFSDNPIIAPSEDHYWERYQTFNPGAVLLDDKVHLVYRAIGVDGISRFGYAVSSDGFRIDERLPHPIYERKGYSLSRYLSASGGGFGGCEDPRLVKIEESNRIYATYNAFGGGLRVGITSIRVDDFLDRKWRWREERLISPPGQVNKNFVIFPEKVKGKYAILHSISPDVSITYLDSLDLEEGEYITSRHRDGLPPAEDGWEVSVKSPGPPPLKTERGWLLFYHGLAGGKYKIGAMLLDYKNPEKVLCTSCQPVIEPDQEYENSGFKPGIVYTCGTAIKDKTLLVYYGGADTYACVAYAWLDEFLDALEEKARLKLESSAMEGSQPIRIEKPKHEPEKPRRRFKILGRFRKGKP
jgi:predicted GH43/DUF377 family glycosyl hydrolase